MGNLRFLDVRGKLRIYLEGGIQNFLCGCLLPMIDSPELPFCCDTFLSASSKNAAKNAACCFLCT